MNFRILILMLGFSAALVQAEDNAPQKRRPRRKDNAPYSLSETGIKRVLNNVRIVEGNIQNAERNLQISRQNQETIQREITEISNMEKEALDMEKKYAKYLENVAPQQEKNEAALKRLSKWKETLLQSKAKNSGEFTNSLQKAEQEQTNRLLWKKDTESKIERIGMLQARAKSNLGKIRIRRSALQEELKEWKESELSYEKQIEELNKKKTAYSNMAEEQARLLQQNSPSNQK